jgi:hypothetical protein
VIKSEYAEKMKSMSFRVETGNGILVEGLGLCVQFEDTVMVQQETYNVSIRA